MPSLSGGDPALADLAFEPFAQTEIARLEELRLTALEARIEADLALGRQDSLVAELETLVAAHPYREGLRAQLMLALYRSGRQAEALETYRRARRTFSEELGIEPGPRLQELEGAILAPRSRRLKHRAGGAAPRGGWTETVRKKRRLPSRGILALAAALVLVIVAAVVAAVRDCRVAHRCLCSSQANPSRSSILERTRSSARFPSEGDQRGPPSAKALSGSAIATTTPSCGSIRDP